MLKNGLSKINKQLTISMFLFVIVGNFCVVNDPPCQFEATNSILLAMFLMGYSTHWVSGLPVTEGKWNFVMMI